MFKSLKSALSYVFRIERRRIKRIPCNIKVHFCFLRKDTQHRGAATITDMHKSGLCCDNLHLYHDDPSLKLSVNNNLTLYFSLPLENGATYNFEFVGKVCSIKSKDKFGHTKRFGIRILSMKRGEKKLFLKCIRLLEEKAREDKEPQS